MGKKKVGVLLSGCGVMDGSEIHEATLTLYFLDKLGAEIICMAPNKNQYDVMDHVAGSPAGETRNVMKESARIARGNIRDVKTVNAADLDAIIIPGGFGAAKNLCTYAREGASCTVDADAAALLKTMNAARKPIGALCIAPSVIASLFGRQLAPVITIGTDAVTAEAMEKMGAKHQKALADEIVVDEKNMIVTTPCYMLAKSIKEVGAGIEKLTSKILELTA